MTRIQIPTGQWPSALADAIEDAQPGDTIIVHNEDMRELAENAAKRMGKTILLEVEAPPDPWGASD